MEEKIERRPLMVGPCCDTDGRGWYAGFGFYWFKIMVFWKWHPHVTVGCQLTPCPWTGIILAYKPNPAAKEGELLWFKIKKWLLRSE